MIDCDKHETSKSLFSVKLYFFCPPFLNKACMHMPTFAKMTLTSILYSIWTRSTCECTSLPRWPFEGVAQLSCISPTELLYKMFNTLTCRWTLVCYRIMLSTTMQRSFDTICLKLAHPRRFLANIAFYAFIFFYKYGNRRPMNECKSYLLWVRFSFSTALFPPRYMNGQPVGCET